jgi:hypothetical protein
MPASSNVACRAPDPTSHFARLTSNAGLPTTAVAAIAPANVEIPEMKLRLLVLKVGCSKRAQSAVGDAGKAAKRLGWRPTRSFKELVVEMVQSDLKTVPNETWRKDRGIY